jgi:predicted GTPase
MSQHGTDRKEIDKKVAYLVARTRDVSADLVDAATVASMDRLAKRADNPAVRVVVVGEVSRGKSTLINALIEQTLLPDAAHALTSTWTILRHGADLAAVARVVTAEGLRLAQLAGADIDAYMTQSGERLVKRRHGANARVASVEIQLPAKILADGLELIDTPGVGGLAAAHRYATLAALDEADALVFVIKPGEPISATERTFLAEALGHLDTCIIVQTQRDLVADAGRWLDQDMATLRSVAEWEALLSDHEEAERLAKLFTVTKSVSVSALNALRAAADPADPANAQLLRNSGAPELAEFLKDVVARGDNVHRLNVLLLIESIARECRRRLGDRVAMLTKSAAGQRLIDERHARLVKWTANGGDHWKPVLDNAYRELAKTVNDHARRRANEVKDEYRRTLRDLNTEGIVEQTRILLTIPDSVLAELNQKSVQAMTKAVAEVRALLVADELDGPLTRLGETSAVFSRLPSGFESAGSGSDVTDIRAVMSGGVVAAGATGLAATALATVGIAVGSAIALPFIIGAGAYRMINRKSREKKRTLQGALDTLDIVCDEIKGTAAPAVLASAQTTKKNLAEVIEAGLAELAAQVEQDRADLAAADDLTPAERQARLDEAEQAMRDVREISASAELLRDELR